MLALLDNSGGPIPDHELNGRVAKALLARAWARFSRGGIEITAARRMVLKSLLDAEGPRRRGRGTRMVVSPEIVSLQGE